MPYLGPNILLPALPSMGYGAELGAALLTCEEQYHGVSTASAGTRLAMS
jgi:hypothetical protein